MQTTVTVITSVLRTKWNGSKRQQTEFEPVFEKDTVTQQCRIDLLSNLTSRQPSQKTRLVFAETHGGKSVEFI